jgi:hypothetical protein
MTTPSSSPHRDSRPGSGVPARLFLLILTAGLIVAGCAQVFDRNDADLWDVASSGGSDITLAVQNDNYYDARIFVRWNGERQRLGLVTGLSSEVFTMTGRTGTMRLEVDFIATRNFISQPVTVGPGDHLTFRIPSRVP